MPLIQGKSDKSFSKNVETEMDAGKPQKQSLAIAYAMKKKAMEHQKAMGGEACEEHGEHGCKMCMGGYAEGGSVEETDKEDHMMDEDDMDLVDRILKKRMSEGGEVANDIEPDVEFEKNQFDDLVKDSSFDGEGDYTGENSGDELGNERTDEDERDIVARIMRSRAKKDRMPRPA